MRARNLLFATASVVLLVAACGGSKSTSTAEAGASSGSTSNGSGGSKATSGSTSNSTSGSSSSGSGPLSCDGLTPVGGALFQATEPWNTPVNGDPVSSQSDGIISWLAANGGWGNGNKLQIDFSINVLCADASTPIQTFVQPNGPCTPDCDDVTTFPVPPGGAVEGESGYACTMGGDCHMLVVDTATNKLWEMWEAFSPPDPNVFNSGSGAVIWDLTKAYPPNLRGDGCSSADAGGFPIAAMLFTADEVKAGHIDHAIRFILPNPRIQGGAVYVHPASHTTAGPDAGSNAGASAQSPDAPPYGVHLRLKPTFDLTQLNAGAQVVAKAMQTYGMLLADGGDIALTAANDQFTIAKWADADVNLGSHDLFAIQVTDFEVVDMGDLVTTGDNCVRNP